jgi:hypothetical protein
MIWVFRYQGEEKTFAAAGSPSTSQPDSLYLASLVSRVLRRLPETELCRPTVDVASDPGSQDGEIFVLPQKVKFQAIPKALERLADGHVRGKIVARVQS